MAPPEVTFYLRLIPTLIGLRPCAAVMTRKARTESAITTIQLDQRPRLAGSWIEKLQAQPYPKKQVAVAELVEEAILSLFPCLKPLGHGAPDYSPPLSDIRNRLSLPTNTTAPPTAGIVIPAGDKNLRFACHLIASLTRIHKTKLPIQVVYAGDKDLSSKGRQKLQAAAGKKKGIEMLDALSVFDDSTLQLVKGGWAIKPFAALASRFDEVILLDADTVFFQDPKELLRQERYVETGALLFHDRLLWKNAFAERQDWWHEQIKHPSKETEKSLVWTERYSEEGESGLVVINKSRLVPYSARWYPIESPRPRPRTHSSPSYLRTNSEDT